MENTRLNRASFQGVVTSTKMDKTIVVLVETYRKHAKYGKRVKYAKKYYVHDEKNAAKVGDTVTIMGTRPISKTKRFRLVSIDKKALAEIKVNETELNVESKLADVKAIEKEVTDKKVAEIKKANEEKKAKEEKKAEEAKPEVKEDAPKAKKTTKKASKEDK